MVTTDYLYSGLQWRRLLSGAEQNTAWRGKEHYMPNALKTRAGKVSVTVKGKSFRRGLLLYTETMEGMSSSKSPLN